MFECEDEDCNREFDTQVGATVHYRHEHDDSGGVKEVECDQCGTTLKRPKSDPNERHFCDKDCDAMWRSENTTGENNPAWKDDNTVEIECAQCGTVREIPRYQYDSTERNFCDLQCYGEWLSENKTGRESPTWAEEIEYADQTVAWKEARAEVLERDQHRCQDCLTPKHECGLLAAHHIVPRRDLETRDDIYDTDNMLALCSSCHASREMNIL